MNRLKSLAGFVLSGSPAEPADAASRDGRRPTSLTAAHSEPSAQAADDHAKVEDGHDNMDASPSRDHSAAGDASDHGGEDDAGGGNDDPDDQDVGDLQEDDDEVAQEEQAQDTDKKKKPQQKRRRRKAVSSDDDDDDDNNHNNAGSDDDGAPAKRLRKNVPRRSKDSATAAAAKSTRSLTPRRPRPRKKATTTTEKKKATKVSKRRNGTAAVDAEEVDELEEEEGGEEEVGEEEEEGDAMGDLESSSDDDLVQLTEAEIAELEDPALVQPFTKLRNGDVDRGPIGVGDVVKLRPSGGSDSWLAVVERISAKKAELKLSEGDNRNESNHVGIQLSWLYARTDFENVHPSNPAWKGPCKVMGPNERVKTDHTDWNHQSMVLSKDPELVYVFDDAYPGIPANDTQPAKHPLSLFSIEALHPIAPSIYSWPALEALSKRSRSIAPITAKRKLPSYFFGVSALPTIDPLLPEEETSGKPMKLDGGKDGVAGIPYVRVGFAFKPLPKIPNGQVEDEAEEEEGATPRKGSPKKKKKVTNGRRKSTAKDSARKVWPLKFAQYSTSERPYNPRNVQHYSRAVETWYDVSNLCELLHSEHEHETKVTREKPDESSPPAFSLDLDAPTFDPGVARVTTLLEKLGHLADDKIVRGGAYGLTGNAYLVIQAGELYERLTTDSASSSSAPIEYDADDVDAARALLADAVAWREEVSRRVKGVQEDHKLAKEWRSVGDEDLPYGHEWLCPESGEPV